MDISMDTVMLMEKELILREYLDMLNMYFQDGEILIKNLKLLA